MNTACAVTHVEPSRAATSARFSSAAIDIDLLRRHVEVFRRKVSAGEYVYRAGQPMQAVFLVQRREIKVLDMPKLRRLAEGSATVH
jgi:hypothetical protein